MAPRSKDNRQPPFSYRPPTGLRAELRTRIQNSGLTANAFITAAIFGGDAPRARPAPRLEQGDAARLLAQVARLNDRLAAGIADQQGSDLLASGRTELVDIRTCLVRLLGREL